MTQAQKLFFLSGEIPERIRKRIPQALFAGSLIRFWKNDAPALTQFQNLFPTHESFEKKTSNLNAWIATRSLFPGVLSPRAESLAQVLNCPSSSFDEIFVIAFEQTLSPEEQRSLSALWIEPAIERFAFEKLSPDLISKLSTQEDIRRGIDPSMDRIEVPESVGLEFSPQELSVIQNEAKKMGRLLTRTEWEVLAQSWSEHCKHKIFGAKIRLKAESFEVKSLFSTYIRKPTLEIREQRPDTYLSIFHDNAGVVTLFDEAGNPTELGIAAKMETHNSPSAISPYGGASTGVVGVHRDILGTGQGALPIANWDVLCFEEPNHSQPRPKSSLPPEIIRSGVVRGVEDGGNQSGIPTVQGSVVFDPRFAVKPFVFAGCLGILPRKYIQKKASPGLVLYAVGGATGADGLRGAVMSSRDLRQEDLVGSAVQVANAFVQRRLTDVLMEARDLDFLDLVTDNGAGGFSSSIGEMAALCGGAQIDLSNVRLKFSGLFGWERLLSESQERMTVATQSPEKFEKLLDDWGIPFDRLGETNSTGRFTVSNQGERIVDLSLDFLFESCPVLELTSKWSESLETSEIAKERASRASKRSPHLKTDFVEMLGHPHLLSREGLVRRFDHEVQGRTLRRPFAGATQNSPQDGSLLEIYENKSPASVVLGHGLAPWRSDVRENVLSSFDEALRSSLLSGLRLDSAGLLDNFSWADPIPSAHNPEGERSLWRLVKSCQTLANLCRTFQLPAISGKDSMKNNSKEFRCPETLVVSLVGSAKSRALIPSGYFLRPNDVVFAWMPLGLSLVDSAWERCFGALDKETSMLHGTSFEQLGDALSPRVRALDHAISTQWIRSAKDISEGGLLTTILEMCLGRNLGFFAEHSIDDVKFWLGEGLSGYVFAVDPHESARIEAALPGIQRIGVVANTPQIHFAGQLGRQDSFDLESLKRAYLKASHEGFWA